MNVQASLLPDTCPACGAEITHAFVERVWSRIEKRSDDQCWPWCGRLTADGYGIIDHGQSANHLAHRLVFALGHGPIAPGLVVRHSCDYPPCCNLRHLLLGTQADNMRDMVVRGRSSRVGVPGEANGNALLTADHVREIRQLYAIGAGSQGEIAAQFGVTRAAICDVVRRKSWRHV